MRNKVYLEGELDIAIQKVFSVFQATLSEENCPQRVGRDISDPSKTFLGLQFLSQKYVSLLGYVILCHYVEDEVLHAYLRLDLTEILKENPEFYWMTVLIENKSFFIKWLESTQQITKEAFFGNICSAKSLRKRWNEIKLRFQSRIRPKRKIRRRGYRDHGSLADVSTRVRRSEYMKDWSGRLEQALIEEQRMLRYRDCRSLKIYLEGVGSLSDEQLMKFRIKRKEKVSHESDRKDC
jgi:hypothetical protein